MWTIKNRKRYDRSHLRYPSDLSDEEWQHIAPLIHPAKQGGRKRTADVREVVNGIMYVLSTGCQWRYLPKDLPPKSTVYRYFDLWNYDGTLEAIHYTLYVKCREAEEREASPTAAIIDRVADQRHSLTGSEGPTGEPVLRKCLGTRSSSLAGLDHVTVTKS